MLSLLLLSLFTVGEVASQIAIRQPIQLEAYYNPAAIGHSSKQLSISALYQRVQEDSLDVRNNYFLAADLSLDKFLGGFAVGVELPIERNELFSKVAPALNISWSYRKKQFSLGLGLKGIYRKHSYELNEQLIQSLNLTASSGSTTPPEEGAKLSGSSFDLGLGLHLSLGQLNVGLAVRNLLDREIVFHEDFSERISRKYNALVSYTIGRESSLLRYRPSIFLEVGDRGKPYRWDGRLDVFLRNSLRLSSSYRWKEAWGLGLGFRLGTLDISYQFERPLKPSFRYSFLGNHEIIVTCSIDAFENKRAQTVEKSIRLL